MLFPSVPVPFRFRSVPEFCSACRRFPFPFWARALEVPTFPVEAEIFDRVWVVPHDFLDNEFAAFGVVALHVLVGRHVGSLADGIGSAPGANLGIPDRNCDDSDNLPLFRPPVDGIPFLNPVPVSVAEFRRFLRNAVPFRSAPL